MAENTIAATHTCSKRRKIRWIHIEHGSDFVQLASWWKSAIAKSYDLLLGRLIFRQSDTNIAISKAVQDFIGRFDHRPSPIIYRGVEIEQIILAPPSWSIREKYATQLIVSFVGRLIDGKGVTDLLRAIKLLNNPNVVCFVIGDGPIRAQLEALTVDLRIAGNVVFWGRKNPSEVWGLLKVSDICVNPSYTEGLPTSVLEACLCRKAVIATDVGGTSEIIKSGVTGYLIPPRQPEAIARQIGILTQDATLRQRLGLAAYDDVAQRFT